MAVLIVCESTMMSDMLVSACSSNGYIVRAASPDLGSLDVARDGDLVLIHASDSGPDVARLVADVRAAPAALRIILLCADGIYPHLRDSLGALVEAVIPEELHSDALVSSMTMVGYGYSLIENGSRRPVPLPKPADAPPLPDGGSDLSKRETLILTKLRDGCSNKDIANQLAISEATVKTHLRASFRKIGVKNRTQAAIWAVAHL